MNTNMAPLFKVSKESFSQLDPHSRQLSLFSSSTAPNSKLQRLQLINSTSTQFQPFLPPLTFLTRSSSTTMRRRTRVLRNPIAFVSVLIFLCFLTLTLVTMLRIPDPTTTAATTTHQSHIGKFGEMMLEMLPEDLPFTVFLPSETAFKRDLRLHPVHSFEGEKLNDTYAVVSRVLGFSAVPRSIVSKALEVSYDSISGFVLYVSKDEEGRLVVNGVRSERVDVTRKGSVVHVMDGALMDAEFQQSVQYDEEED